MKVKNSSPNTNTIANPITFQPGFHLPPNFNDGDDDLFVQTDQRQLPVRCLCCFIKYEKKQMNRWSL